MSQPATVLPLDINAIIEDTASARVRLFNTHCVCADDPQRALIALASQFLHQGTQLLEAYYGGNAELARKHVLLFMAGEPA